VKKLARKYGLAQQVRWDGSVPNAKRLKSLKVENARLKKLLAEPMLENELR